ncbi:MAG: DUF3857 domain-containing protein [candidate division WOR-3 bacterium]
MGNFKKIIIFFLMQNLFSANVEILKSIEKIKIERESIFKEVEIKMKILNERGTREAGTQEIEFNEKFEKINLVYGRTINDRDTINLKDYSINIFPDPEIEEYPFLLNNKIMSLSFLGVQKNSIVEYKYKKMSKFEGKYDEIFIFREDYPVKEKIVEFEFPEDIKFKYKIKGDIDFREERGNKKIKYTFSAKDLKEIKDEERRPPDYSISPFIHLTNYSSWEEIVNEFKRKYFESKRCEGIEFKDVLDILKEVKVAKVSYDYTGFYPDSCERTVKLKIGTAPERAFLMIKKMESPELIVVLKPLLNPDTILPGISWIDGILIKDKEKIYDPKFEFGNINYYPFSNRKGIFINKERFYISEIPVSQKNMIEIEISIDLISNLLNINYKTCGIFDKIAKTSLFEYEKILKRDFLKEVFLKDILSEFGEFEDESIEGKNTSSFEENLEIEISSKIKNLTARSGNFEIIEIPELFKYPFYISKINEERENLYFNDEDLSLILKIHLAGKKLDLKTKRKEIKKGCGRLLKEIIYDDKEYKTHINLFLEIKRGILNKKEIREYNNLIEEFFSKENRVFILKF